MEFRNRLGDLNILFSNSESDVGGQGADQLGPMAIAYHYFAHYRLSVLAGLNDEWTKSGSSLTLLSDTKTNTPSIKLIDEDLLGKPDSPFGFRWERLVNRWLKGSILWQSGLVGFALKDNHRTMIYLASPYFLSTWVAAIISRIRGKRVLFWTHGVTHDDRPLMKLIRKTFYSLADGLLLYGNWARERLSSNFGLRPDRLYVIFNSLDFGRQKELRARLTDEVVKETREELFPDSPGDPILVAVGRLTSKKKLDQLIRTGKSLGESGNNVNLLFIGEGEDRSHLESLSERMGLLGRTRFVGSCYDEEALARYVGSSDICVIPGALGLSVIHSLAFGTPVMGHNDPRKHGPEFEAIIPGFNGDFFVPDDIESMVGKISEWLNQDLDEGTIRENCSYVLEKYYNPTVQVRLIRAAVSGKDAESIPVRAPLD